MSGDDVSVRYVGERFAVSDTGPGDAIFIPLELCVNNMITAERRAMSCYPDHFEIDGKTITDAEAVEFIKGMARELTRKYESESRP